MKNEFNEFVRKITAKVIYDWDPLYYNNADQAFDYSKVIEKISALVKERILVCDFAVMVRDIFVEEFGKKNFLFESNECQNPVYDIYCAIANYEYVDKEICISYNDKIKTVILKKLITEYQYLFEITFENRIYRSEKIEVIHNADEYLLFTLNKVLPNNAEIVCCNTCRFGNFSPYGGTDIFCFKTINVDSFTDKLDVLDNFTDEVLGSRHDFNFYCEDFAPQSKAFVYNDYHYYAFHPDEKPYYLEETKFYEQHRQYYNEFTASLNKQYRKNEMEPLPQFTEYLKLKFSGASIVAKNRMEILAKKLTKQNIAEKLKFVHSFCSTCDEFNFYEIWPSVFSVPLCDFVFKVLKPYADSPDADFLTLKWIALYALIYCDNKKLKLAYFEKALVACDYKDEVLLKSKSYIS